MYKTPVAVLLSSLFLSTQAPAATLIYAGKLITAEDKKVLSQHTIVVEQDKIIALEAGASVSFDGIAGKVYQRENLRNPNFIVSAVSD